MDDRYLLRTLELKFNSYNTKIRDLEAEVARLNRLLKEREALVIEDGEKVELTKNNS
jgi:hypothetical protein